LNADWRWSSFSRRACSYACLDKSKPDLDSTIGASGTGGGGFLTSSSKASTLVRGLGLPAFRKPGSTASATRARPLPANLAPGIPIPRVAISKPSLEAPAISLLPVISPAWLPAQSIP